MNIEFRVFCKARKKYFPVLCWDFAGVEIAKGVENTVLLEKDDGYFTLKDVIVEQFTGVLDKNKNKIFVGDIIKCMGKKNAVIVFHKGSFGFFIDATFYELSYWNTNKIEIIGSEKLNPELVSV